MQDIFKKVGDFQKTIEAPIAKNPEIPTRERVVKIVKAIDAQLTELERASYRGDLIDVLQALCDLNHFVMAAVLEYGLQDVFEEAINEVHKSNMSNFCATTQIAQETTKRYQFRQIEATYKLVNGKHIILKSSDDSLLPGIHFFEPRLRKVLEKFKKPAA